MNETPKDSVRERISAILEECPEHNRDDEHAAVLDRIMAAIEEGQA